MTFRREIQYAFQMTLLIFVQSIIISCFIQSIDATVCLCVYGIGGSDIKNYIEYSKSFKK